MPTRSQGVLVLLIFAGILAFRVAGFSMSNSFEPGTVGHLEKVVCASISFVGLLFMIGLAIVVSVGGEKKP